MAFVAGREQAVSNVSESTPESPGATQTASNPRSDETGGNKFTLNENSTAPAGRVRLGNQTPENSSVRTAVLTDDGAGDASTVKIIPLSHRMVSGDQSNNPRHFTPAEPRIDAAFGRMSPADIYPDEYLADGGDRRLPGAGYRDWDRPEFPRLRRRGPVGFGGPGTR